LFPKRRKPDKTRTESLPSFHRLLLRRFFTVGGRYVRGAPPLWARPPYAGEAASVAEFAAWIRDPRGDAAHRLAHHFAQALVRWLMPASSELQRQQPIPRALQGGGGSTGRQRPPTNFASEQKLSSAVVAGREIRRPPRAGPAPSSTTCPPASTAPASSRASS
jgi:hypothetical protein